MCFGGCLHNVLILDPEISLDRWAQPIAGNHITTCRQERPVVSSDRLRSPYLWSDHMISLVTCRPDVIEILRARKIDSWLVFILVLLRTISINLKPQGRLAGGSRLPAPSSYRSSHQVLLICLDKVCLFVPRRK